MKTLFTYKILISSLFTFDLGRGGPPRPKEQILDLLKLSRFSRILILVDLCLMPCEESDIFLHKTVIKIRKSITFLVFFEKIGKKTQSLATNTSLI